MNYMTSVCTDIGIRKEVNQDAILVRKAETDMGNILFAVICDGMGGLEQGEVASATVITHMSQWFEQIFPGLLYQDFTPDRLKESWLYEITELNERIRTYGERNHISLGTTMVSLLLIDDAYYICNVGDSRVYYLGSNIQQMTHDQSYVQREMDMGRMTKEEARVSRHRNMLLQCIGASSRVMPDFYVGEYQKNSAFILCSDGFRHVISKEEMWEEMQPQTLKDQEFMDEKVKEMVELVKNRQEEDNISVILIHAL